MSAPGAGPDRRWPRSVYGVGTEPDPRFSFANERTFLAWIRTGLGFVAAGVAVAAVVDLNPGIGPAARLAAVVLIVCGVISGVGALTRWMKNERAMRRNEPLPSSPLLAVLTAGVVVVAVIAFIVVGVS
jgi:putative membrane protein